MKSSPTPPALSEVLSELVDRVGLPAALERVRLERKRLTEDRQREIVRRVVEEHESIRATASALGVSRTWVHRALERAGVPRLSPNPPRPLSFLG